jgi:hypothetical protein
VIGERVLAVILGDIVDDGSNDDDWAIFGSPELLAQVSRSRR